ncbi:MAG: FAD-dependent oxidoreductase [Lentisphaerae bacterium]|nr:FAD-dependent oxidoreductase [Lentisphaerota bacterium]
MATPKKAWRCTVCGYVHHGDAPPDVCPVCGSPSTAFEPWMPQPAPAFPAHRWQCLNCNFVHDGPQPPDDCPVCGAVRDRFQALQEAREATPVSGRDMTVVVVGAGIAGVSAVESVRQAAPHARIVLLSREEVLPYYRLNLTRYVAGEIRKDVLPIHPETWYRENGIVLRLAADVTALDPAGHSLTLKGGERLSYHQLVLALGAHPFIPPFPGAQLKGVTALRTTADADFILDAAAAGRPCVCIGGGILGLETAGGLALRGADVTLLEGHGWLMPRQLNRRAGELLAEAIGKLGIKLRLHATTGELLGEGSVRAVRLEDGVELPAGLVIVTTGIRSNTHLARQAGLEVNAGIVVNNLLATSLPDIYAAGDVAEHHGIVYGIWSASQFEGAIAGLNAAGRRTVFGGLPRSNTLKVLGLDLVSIGKFEPEDAASTVIEQESGGRYSRFVFRDGRMLGAVLLGDASVGPQAKKAIETGLDFSGVLAGRPSASDIAARLASV